jgi:hypothetical protein
MGKNELVEALSEAMYQKFRTDGRSWAKKWATYIIDNIGVSNIKELEKALTERTNAKIKHR